MANQVTMLADLFDPEVLGDFIEQKYADAIRLAPLAVVNNQLEMTAGSKIVLPSYDYSGDAVDVAEGQAIPIDKITMTKDEVEVSKIGKAVEFTDEARIMAAGNIVDEVAKQILVAINSKVEAKLLDEMSTKAKLTASISLSADPADSIADALLNFGEEIDGPKVLVIPPTFHNKLLKSKSWIPNTEIGADTIVRGTVGSVHGCQVITSNRLLGYELTSDTTVGSKNYYKKVGNAYIKDTPTADPSAEGFYELKTPSAYIIKPGALAIYSKRGTLVEQDRDILREIDVVKGSKIFAPYVYDKSKLIKLTFA